MRSMRSMRGGLIFRSHGPSLKAHHGQRLPSMTLVDRLPGPHATARSRLMAKREVPFPDGGADYSKHACMRLQWYAFNKHGLLLQKQFSQFRLLQELYVPAARADSRLRSMPGIIGRSACHELISDSESRHVVSNIRLMLSNVYLCFRKSDKLTMAA